MIQLFKKDISSGLDRLEQCFYKRSAKSAKGQVLLKTCNRVELYAGEGPVPPDITRHLFRVVSGLESPLVGETAIQGQVKKAYSEAQLNGQLSKELHRLFKNALSVGKKVRTQTPISQGACSHSQVVLNMLERHCEDLTTAIIVILGVTHLNEAILRYLVKKIRRPVFIANRTYEKAKTLANVWGGQALMFDCLVEQLAETDVLISATSAPHYVVKKEQLPKNHRMLVFDLAVPRDIDPAIAELPLVTLYNIEEINSFVTHSVSQRMDTVSQAEEIIEEEIRKFYEKN